MVGLVEGKNAKIFVINCHKFVRNVLGKMYLKVIFNSECFQRFRISKIKKWKAYVQIKSEELHEDLASAEIRNRMQIDDNVSASTTITAAYVFSLITVNKEKSKADQEEDNQKVNLLPHINKKNT